MRENDLIHRYLLGNLDESEVVELDRLLAASPELRREFRLAAQTDAALREVSIERGLRESASSVGAPAVDRTSPRLVMWVFSACALLTASVLIALGVWWRPPAGVATLVSSENAAWESVLPTTPGSELAPGTLKLRAGMATVRFHSGAEVLVEAPAELTLFSRMRARLDSGAAVVTVPEPAVGFVLETPSGYAIDHGTRFAVSVDEDGQGAGFELIEGEIEVRSEGVSESLRLTEVGSRAAVSNHSVRMVDEPADERMDVDPESIVVRIGTDGRCGSAMPRFDRRGKAIRPENLYVKRSESGRWDFRSFFAFDLADTDLDDVTAARLRLNLVPSHKGFASRLPEVSRFGVYGLTNPEKADWNVESTWEEAPAPEDGVLLGTFEIARSLQRGTFGIEGPKLLEFLKRHRDDDVTFILVRETMQVHGTGPGLTHLFASDRHPESVGPLLEITVRREDDQ